MSKIVQAVNVMIANKDKISNVKKGTFLDEYYFVYNSKYVWSIGKSDNDLYLTSYPLDSFYFETPEKYAKHLSGLDPDECGKIDYVCYSTKELNTREATESFRELYTTVKEKILGIDTMLDDIINNDETVQF